MCSAQAQPRFRRHSRWKAAGGCLRDTIPKLTRSALHRCLLRHGIPRLPRDDAADSKRKAFKETKIGYVHIDSAQFRSAEGGAAQGSARAACGMAAEGRFICSYPP